MQVTKDNTQTIIDNMRSEGQNSRADYLELLQQQNIDLLEALKTIERRADRLSEWAMYKGGTGQLHMEKFRDEARAAIAKAEG